MWDYNQLRFSILSSQAAPKRRYVGPCAALNRSTPHASTVVMPRARATALVLSLAAAFSFSPPPLHTAVHTAAPPRAPRPASRCVRRSAVDFRMAEDDASPIALASACGRSLDAFPGCFLKLEEGGPWRGAAH